MDLLDEISVADLIEKEYTMDSSLLVQTINDMNDDLERKVDAILNGGGDINGVNHNGNTLLHIILKSHCVGAINLVPQLLEGGANVQLQNGLGETPLMLAIRKSPVSVYPILMSKYGKETVNIPCKEGYYPIHCAAKAKCNAVDILLRHGAEVNCKDNLGRTPLHCAVKEKRVYNVALLLKMGAEVNSQDNVGKTPLHHLASFLTLSDKRFRIGNTLLDWGASLTIKDDERRTPMDICPDLVYCSKEHNIRRACVKPPGFLNDDLELQIYKTYCLEEVERLKLVQFGDNSLYDVFDQYSDPFFFLANDPLKEALNINDYGDQFPIYSSLLKYTYKRANERAYLLETVADTLKTHSKKVFETLPREVTWYILTFLDDECLRNVMETIV